MFRRSLFRKDIAPQCAYCANGRLKEDKSVVFCTKKGVMALTDSCKKFVYAPTKREPLRQNKLPDFSEEDFSI